MKLFAQIFGAALLLAGIAGFVPALTPDGKLLGFFAVNAAHNLVHVATGVLALVAAAMGESWMRNFFRIFGVVYALVAVLGIYSGDRPLLGIVAHNTADMVLHFAVAAVALFVGFVGIGRVTPPPRGPDLRGA